MSGSAISWAICKSAPHCRQITTPAPHHSVFLQAGCPSCRPTNSVKALKAVVVVLSAKKISSQSAFERTQNYRIVPYHKRSTRLSYVHQDLDLADEDYEKLEEKNRALVRVVTKLSSRWVATEWSRCLYSQHWAYFCYVEMTFHVVCSLLLSS